MSKFHKGNSYAKGYIRTAEYRQKVREGVNKFLSTPKGLLFIESKKGKRNDPRSPAGKEAARVGLIAYNARKREEKAEYLRLNPPSLPPLEISLTKKPFGWGSWIKKSYKNRYIKKGYSTASRPSPMKGIKRPELSGDKHPRWKGGVTKYRELIAGSIEYKNWQKGVFERDNWECQRCHIHGGILVAHHIRNFANHKELRFDINNGVTFCPDCHDDFHFVFDNKDNNWEQLNRFILTL